MQTQTQNQKQTEKKICPYCQEPIEDESKTVPAKVGLVHTSCMLQEVSIRG